MARCLELGERRWVGIVTMSAKKLGLEATLRPVGRPRIDVWNNSPESAYDDESSFTGVRG
jgi:hypothetical protein